jgi:hypothetical protein
MPPMNVPTYLMIAGAALAGRCSPASRGRGPPSASARVPDPAGVWEAWDPADLGMDHGLNEFVRPVLAWLRQGSVEGPDGR